MNTVLLTSNVDRAENGLEGLAQVSPIIGIKGGGDGGVLGGREGCGGREECGGRCVSGEIISCMWLYVFVYILLVQR